MIVETRATTEKTGDSIRDLCADWALAEIRHVARLRSCVPLYGSPLTQLGVLSPQDFSKICQPITALAETCNSAAAKMKELLDNWKTGTDMIDTIGNIFDEKFWGQYEIYQSTYRSARQTIREKSKGDDDFVELCKLRKGAAKFGLMDILDLPVHRLAQYEEYFENLLSDVHGDQIRDHEELQAARTRAKQAVKRAQEESDLERIQDLFPNDCLRLYDKDVLTMRMKGLMRKKSSTATRLQRALSAKSLRPESPPPRQGPPQAEKRQFIMETKVQFTAGVQSQERHLFLFNDLLLIAKARSGGNFKLKEKVRVSEIWMCLSGIEDVCEVSKSKDTSFVLGWPTTNFVATFSTQAARDLWWSKLADVVSVEKAKEPCTTNIQVIYYDQATSIEYCKTFSVGPDETARSCISMALDHLDLLRDPDGYQLWAKTARDEAPYPLLGHERPFAIKLSCLRDSLSAEEGFDLDHCNNVHDPLARCQFILRSVCKTPDSEKKLAKKSTGRIRIGQVFRKSLSKENAGGCLFGLPLQRICPGDQLPRPVMNMLQQVFNKGPFTQGIFRKSANVRLVRELREKMDRGEEVVLDHVPVPVVASLLKEFLRSLPDPLLSASLYPRWREALEAPNIHQRLLRLKGVIEDMPKLNRLLLYHVLCVLHHVGRRSCTNLMSPTNLGVCVGPSLLWSDSVTPGDLRAVPMLVETLVTHCEFLCGPRVTHLLGDPRDSGTEESDSLRRDDSSIDSLECSPPPRKDKISLSRDSGLTMSDSQLYTPDEEESGSTSSSGYDPAFDPHAKVTPTMSVPGEYVRVYGGWEERINPNFQRQAWFRQRSRRLNSIPQTKTDVRRSASEESLLDNPAPPTPPRQNKPDLKPFDEMFNRHPPLRKVTAVHCEVISEPRRRQYREAVYSAKKPLSVSSADLTRLKQSTAVQRPSLPQPPTHPRLEEQEDSSTLSDDDCTPQVSRSNSRGNEVTPRLRHLPPVHVETSYLRGRLRTSSDQPAHRSRSLPPPQQINNNNNTNNKRAPITSYYLPVVSPYIVTRAYRDEESYV
ncbi:rho GTPase-activating protein 20-like isoform X3 [Cimex lectularius]|uniref:Rho GTPase-activating protein 20 n=1 Tax=Cimex lectularius TaxID=79782 RepID=A0A8I6SFI5_CIMLE|nr:rho GTPase-activating protein 20-like isoform X3 [Cimex lectularius]